MTSPFHSIPDNHAFWLVFQNAFEHTKFIWLTLENRSHDDGRYYNCLLIDSNSNNLKFQGTDFRFLSHSTEILGPEEWQE